ncbi:peptide deformylase [bacterium]|nr:peptide deformylase [candidate division CSSED10-310 bacterium]
MANRTIKTYGEPVLRENAREISEITQGIRRLAMDMIETMRTAPGIGLAAPQVGESVRLIVVTFGIEEDSPRPRVLINPELIWHNDDVESCEEGCLSVPDVTGVVSRWTEIRIRAMTLDGDTIEEILSGWTARIFQHELDHLDGILFIDRLSRLKRDLVKRRLKKRLRSETAAM